MKRIVTIQDISCLGKCSLTVALPIISAMGVECSIIPTAVLSTHTQFSGFTFCDLTKEIEPIGNHWKKENFKFDSIYTGYLGSFEQLKLVSDFFDDFKTEKNNIVIDPVMADNGVLYKGFTVEFAKSMAKLCGKADYIMPNLTEASFMLDFPYEEGKHDRKYYENIIDKLLELGTKTAILTGVSLNDGKLGVMSRSKNDKEYFYYEREHLPVSFHGTGDIFASAFTGGVTLGYTAEKSLEIAVNYTVETIKKTLSDPEANSYGTNFELAIPYLLSQLK